MGTGVFVKAGRHIRPRGRVAHLYRLKVNIYWNDNDNFILRLKLQSDGGVGHVRRKDSFPVFRFGDINPIT